MYNHKKNIEETYKSINSRLYQQKFNLHLNRTQVSTRNHCSIAIVKKNIPMITNRINAIIEFMKYEKAGISKRVDADVIGVNHNSEET